MLLALKIALVPVLVALASLLGRRFGPTVSGWLIGLPIVAGPILLFLAIEQGDEFAASAAMRCAVAISGVVVFCVSYAHLARRWRWFGCVVTSYAATIIAIAILSLVPDSLMAAVFIPLVALGLGPALLPKSDRARLAVRAPPRWDIPVRMLATAVLVLSITESASRMGPGVSGLLAPFPCATTVLAVFTHQQDGSTAVARMFVGLFRGLYSFLGFCIVVATTIESSGWAISFASATAVGLVIHGVGRLSRSPPRIAGLG